MNKQILFKLLIFILLMSIQIPVFGAAAKTEIRVKVGQNIIKVNGHPVKTEIIFSKNGTTMVPLRIIANLLGADLETELKQKSITVFANNKNIKFITGKNIAYINGLKSQISMPVEVNGTTMVPLRTLAEGFNAVISKDSKTGEIITVFPFQSFEKIFNYINNGWIGDSYYGWSVMFPKNSTLDEKKPSGTSLLVRNPAGGYYFYIFNVSAGKNLKEDNLLDELISYVNDEKIIGKKLTTEKGRTWATIVLESEDEIYQYKAAIKGGRLYQIHFYTTDKTGFLDNNRGKTYKNIINSFSIDYKGNSPEIIDINEIEKGIYTYKEKSSGWTVNLPAQVNLEVQQNSNSYKILDERGQENGLSFGVDIYPIEKDETIESYSKAEIESLNQNIDRDCFLAFAEKDSKISEAVARKIYYKIKTQDSSVCFFNAIIFTGEWKFHIYVYGKSNLFEGEDSDLGDRIIQSFSLPDIEIKKVILNQGSSKAARGNKNLQFSGIDSLLAFTYI